MNPLTQIKNTIKATKREIELGISDSASWHAEFKHSAYVFIGGLDYELTEGDVLAVFSQYGEIVDLNLVRDKTTGKPRGFAFVAYEDQRSTNLAVDNLSGATVAGRTVRVQHVKNYKKQKAEMEGETIPDDDAEELPPQAQQRQQQRPQAVAGDGGGGPSARGEQQQWPSGAGPGRVAPWDSGVGSSYASLMEEARQMAAAKQAAAAAAGEELHKGKKQKKEKKEKKEKKDHKHRKRDRADSSSSSDDDDAAGRGGSRAAPVTGGGGGLGSIRPGSFGPPRPLPRGRDDAVRPSVESVRDNTPGPHRQAAAGAGSEDPPRRGDSRQQEYGGRGDAERSARASMDRHHSARGRDDGRDGHKEDERRRRDGEYPRDNRGAGREAPRERSRSPARGGRDMR